TSQFRNQRTVIVARGVVQQTGIQCFNYKEFGHFAKQCIKPKREKDYTYHKEKMLLCKQAEKGVPLQADQADWLEDTDEEVNEQELEAHYMYMAKIQEVPTTDSRPSFDADVTPRQGRNARRDEKGNHHNTLASIRETKTCIKIQSIDTQCHENTQNTSIISKRRLTLK
ncbi:putative ribonuclease H-like domain-containing protein, partial [Tanacetum coccineum]